MNINEINNKLKKLKENRLLRNKDEFINFEQAIAELSDVTDYEVIRGICEAFDDNTEDEEVMFALVHFIEDFEGEQGLLETAKSIPYMIDNARRWAKILHYRILNDDSSRVMYAAVVRRVDSKTKNIVIDMLNEILNEDPKEFKQYVTEVLDKLNV